MYLQGVNLRGNRESRNTLFCCKDGSTSFKQKMDPLQMFVTPGRKIQRSSTPKKQLFQHFRLTSREHKLRRKLILSHCTRPTTRRFHLLLLAVILLRAFTTKKQTRENQVGDHCCRRMLSIVSPR